MDDQSVIEELIKKWAEDYKRIFGAITNGVVKSEEEQASLKLEIQRCVDDYIKWFENKPDAKEQEAKLFKLRQLREYERLHVDSLEKVIAEIERELSQSRD